jgi:hypothetical protein
MIGSMLKNLLQYGGVRPAEADSVAWVTVLNMVRRNHNKETKAAVVDYSIRNMHAMNSVCL